MPTKPLRRKAKQDRAMETIDIILTAAAQVLETEGSHATTTNKIADRAGVSVGSIYQYFDNKQEIFGKLLEREKKRMVDELTNFNVIPSRSFEQNLAAYLTIGGGNVNLNPELFRQLERIDGLEAALEDLNQLVTQSVADFLRSFCPKCSNAQIKRMARMIVLSAEGLGHRSSRGDLDAGMLAEYIQMITAYVKVSRAKSEPRSKVSLT